MYQVNEEKKKKIMNLITQLFQNYTKLPFCSAVAVAVSAVAIEHCCFNML